MSRRRERRRARKAAVAPEPESASAPESVVASPLTARAMLLAALALFVVTFVAYTPTLEAGFIWDDDDYVTENELLHDTSGLNAIWFRTGATPQYYPLVFTTFWLEYQLWELDPTGYHVVNILLHATAAFLAWLVLRRLAVPGAWIVAAVFALHPVHVESVAWITERKNVLSGVFYLAALLAFLRFDASSGSTRWFAYVGSLVLFLAALCSKTVTCSLPAAILLILFWKRSRLRRNDVFSVTPMLLVGMWFARRTVDVEKVTVFKYDVDFGLSVLDRILIAGRAVWFYAAKLLWPRDLSFMYPRWAVDPAVWWQWLFPILALALVAGLWLARKRITTGPVAAVLLFGGTLLPALGFVDVYPMYYSFVADHFQYLASLPVLALVVAAAAARLPALTLRLAAGAVLVILGSLTWTQGHAYRDLPTLWKSTLETNPDALMATINLTNLMVKDGDDQGAVDILAPAIASIDPAVVHEQVLARAYYNQGNNLGRLRRYRESREHYERAIEVDPTYTNAYSGLGWAWERLNRRDKAIEAYRELLKRVPGHRTAVERLRALGAN